MIWFLVKVYYRNKYVSIVPFIGYKLNLALADQLIKTKT